jgi:hypothetical protein
LDRVSVDVAHDADIEIAQGHSGEFTRMLPIGSLKRRK